MLLIERYPWFALPNRLVGLVVAGIGLLVVSRRGQALPREILLFGLFICWAGATGYAIAGNPAAVTPFLRVLSQEWALALGVAAYSWRRGTADEVFRCMLLVALVLAAYLFTGGEVGVGEVGPQTRVMSLMSNPNGLGIASLWGIVGVAWLWPTVRTSWFWRAVLAASVPILVLVIVLSASRKSFIALMAFGLFWYLFAQLPGTEGRFRKVAGAVVLLVLGFFAMNVLLPESTLEQRLQRTREDPRLDSSRYGLYQEGFEMFQGSPVTGVGLGNYRVRSTTGQLAHSDSMEVLSTTGLVGFGLYFSIYASMGLRLRRLLRRVRSSAERYSLGLCVAILVTVLLLGLGVPLFLMPFHWLVLAGVLGMLARWEWRFKLIDANARAATRGASWQKALRLAPRAATGAPPR